MVNYKKAYGILHTAAIKEIDELQMIPKACFCTQKLKMILEQSSPIERKYTTLCAVMSDVIDQLAEIPLASKSMNNLILALEQAEEVYIRTAPHAEEPANGLEIDVTYQYTRSIRSYWS